MSGGGGGLGLLVGPPRQIPTRRAPAGAGPRRPQDRIPLAHAKLPAFADFAESLPPDLRRGFFNGSSLFYCPAGREQDRFEVEMAGEVARRAAGSCRRKP